MKNHLKDKIKNNWKSGITVSFVSLPLSISLAVAAGATPLMGVITAIWAGLAASIWGGSKYNIVGPTGALSGLLIVYSISYGVSILPYLAIFSGIGILAIFLLRWEKYIIFIPSSVVHGFTLGVAFIIAFGQLNSALGIKNLTAHEKFISNLKETLLHINQFDLWTLILFILGIIFLFGWKKYFTNFPGAIILAPVGIFIGYLSNSGMLPIEFQTLFSKFGDISGNLIHFPELRFNFGKDVFVGAFAISIIAILESLLSAKIADGMTKTKHSSRKEVFGLGIANIASGIFGGIPATAALARTTLNIKSGAKDRMSAKISSIGVVIISLLLLSFFKYLPMAIVAAILVFVASQMIEKEHLIRFYRYEKSMFFLLLLVALVTVVEDPIVGVLAGTAISLLILINKMSFAETEVTINKNNQVIKRVNASQLLKIKDHGDVLVYRFAGQLSYVNCQSHINNINCINGEAKNVILSLRNCFFVDIDGMDAFKEIIETLKLKNKNVYITAVNGIVEDLFKREKWFEEMRKKEMIYASTQEALNKC
ncbi:MAG: hypothetical protein ACD_11C00004G0011 [uncultured bacterium]|nr:MAG: hypothetical protein ACD_11C00004G0011 [uncultured bacterium]